MRNIENESPLNLRGFLATSGGKENTPISNKEIRYNDMCAGSAFYILKKVTDYKEKNLEIFQNYETYEKSKIFQQLFQDTKPNKKEEIHSLFWISHTATHVYVIEKVWNEINNVYSYYIHQSYFEKFTLGEWEETDPWVFSEELKQDKYIKHYSQYRGKALSLADIQGFIRAEIQFQQYEKENNCIVKWELNRDGDAMKVKAYVVDNKKLQQIEHQINPQLRLKSLLTLISESARLNPYHLFAITTSSEISGMIDTIHSDQYPG